VGGNGLEPPTVLESGGHLMVGQSDLLRKLVGQLLRQHRIEYTPSQRRHDRTVRRVLEPVT